MTQCWVEDSCGPAVRYSRTAKEAEGMEITKGRIQKHWRNCALWMLRPGLAEHKSSGLRARAKAEEKERSTMTPTRAARSNQSSHIFAELALVCAQAAARETRIYKLLGIIDRWQPITRNSPTPTVLSACSTETAKCDKRAFKAAPFPRQGRLPDQGEKSFRKSLVALTFETVGSQNWVDLYLPPSSLKLLVTQEHVWCPQ